MSWNKTEVDYIFIQRGIHWIVSTDGLEPFKL